MKNNNEMGYPCNVRNTDDFVLSSLLDSSYLARDLDEAYQAISAGTQPDTRSICASFGCTDREAMVISVLAHFDGHVTSPEILSRELRSMTDQLRASVESLSRKELVCIDFLSRVIALSGKAVKCIKMSCCADELSDYAVIDWLRGIDLDAPEEICDESGIPLCFIETEESPSRGRIWRFAKKLSEKGLSEEAAIVFWRLCVSYIKGFTAPYEYKCSRSVMSELIRAGWVEVFASANEASGELTKKDNYCLSSSAAKELFAGMDELIDYSAISALGVFKNWKSIEEKQLFFNESEGEELKRIERIAGSSEFNRIKKGLDDRHLRVSISSIFHGPSGTGKTEFAMQVARKTKRDIVLVDASKLHGSYWGEDERNYRDLFRIFRHIVALSNNAPILFIDEGEGILGQRTAGANTRAERSSNIIQNIILEELNNFCGILFVTTNDASGLDRAMDRRFLTKVEFRIPDESTRKRIWMSKMEGRITDSEADVLARKFVFSGGHIDNVVTQSAIDEILDDKKCDLEELVNYCMKEDGFSCAATRRKIGF